MDRETIRQQVLAAVGGWVDRAIKDHNLLAEFGGATLTVDLRHEGLDDDHAPHFEAVVTERRHIVLDSDREHREAGRDERD